MDLENISHIRQCPELTDIEFLWQFTYIRNSDIKTCVNGSSVGIWEYGQDCLKVKHSTVSQPR
jgi:hypothetical protein